MLLLMVYFQKKYHKDFKNDKMTLTMDQDFEQGRSLEKASTKESSAAIQWNLPVLATIPSNENTNDYVTLLLNNNEILALVDSGSSSSSFIDKSLVHQLNIKVIHMK